MSVVLSLLLIPLLMLVALVWVSPEILLYPLAKLADASFKKCDDGSYSVWQRAGQFVFVCAIVGLAAYCLIGAWPLMAAVWGETAGRIFR